MTTFDDPEESLRNEASLGNIRAVTYLLSMGTNPNCRDLVTNWTPLHIAARYGHLDVIKILLEHLANPELLDCEGLTPAQVASTVEIKQLLSSASDDGTMSPVLLQNSPPAALVTSMARMSSQSSLKKVKNVSAKSPVLGNPFSQSSSLRTFPVAPGSSPLVDSPFSKNEERAAAAEEFEAEILIFNQKREDSCLIGAVFVLSTDPVRVIVDKISAEIDAAPKNFMISRHNGQHIVPINKKQLEQPIALHFRADDVVVLTPVTSTTSSATPILTASNVKSATTTAAAGVLETAQASATAGIAALSSFINRNSSQKPDHLLKLFIVGDSGVGKSCLLLRFTEDAFYSAFVSTIGIDFKSRIMEVDGKLVKMEIWDTAGQERFRTITNAFYRRARGAVIVYDVSNRASFLRVRSWYTDVRLNGEENTIVVIVGNKCDNSDLRAVTVEEGQALADEFCVHFFETSAKCNTGVNDLFIDVAREMLKRIALEEEEEQAEAKSSTSNAGTSSGGGGGVGIYIRSAIMNERVGGGCCGSSSSSSSVRRT